MKSIKMNYMLAVKIIPIFVILVGTTFFCSEKKEEKTQQFQVKPRQTRSYEPVIAKVELEPAEPTSVDDIQAIATLKDRRKKNAKFHYQWFVNRDMIPGKEDSHLEKKHYKKNDKVYCRVKASMGIHESKVVKSRELKIKNAVPIITLGSWENVKIGKTFQYMINATDPDNDLLTYHLVSPLDLGIQVDPNSGEISWDTGNIPQPEPGSVETEAPAEIQEGSEEGGGEVTPTPEKRQVPPFVEIVFEVRDRDGASVTSAIKFEVVKETEETTIPQ